MKDTRNDFQEIINIIHLYFEGTYYGDVEKIKKAFCDNARITGVINKEYFDWSLDDFITRVITSPTAQDKNEKYDKEIICIDKTNNTAMVKTRVLVGEFVFTDYINLLKIKGEWRIRNKSFTN